MATIVLGNVAPIEPIKPDPRKIDIIRRPRPDLGNVATRFESSGPLSTTDVLQIAEVFKSHHSDADPAWVESDDKVVAQILAREFGCKVGRPKGWEEG